VLVHTLVIIPLASIRKYKKVIKINLTTASNSKILRSLVDKGIDNTARQLSTPEAH
jgi:hypothetical protein